MPFPLSDPHCSVQDSVQPRESLLLLLVEMRAAARGSFPPEVRAQLCF